MPKERPILFSGPMVRAIPQDLKTQTRRVINLPDYFSEPEFAEDGYADLTVEWSDNVADAEYDDLTEDTPKLPAGWFVHSEEEEHGWSPVRCPYGQPGDRLWIRETWTELMPEHKTTVLKAREAVYKADCDATDRSGDGERCRQDYIRAGYPYKWKPSIHMPRWASRFNLLVTEVRPQRLQDISEEDAQAEGLIQVMTPDLRPGWGLPGWHKDMFTTTAKEAFRILWGSINGKREGAAWEDNPWCWAVSFKRVQ